MLRSVPPMPAPHVAPSRSPRRPGAGTALLLVIAALAVVAATMALVLMGPRDRTPAVRTVSVAPFEPPGPTTSGSPSENRIVFDHPAAELAALGAAAAEGVGWRIDGELGLAWLPEWFARSPQEAAAADVDVTGSVRWTGDRPWGDSLLYEMVVRLADRVDTVRLAVDAEDGYRVAHGLADSLLAALSGGTVDPSPRRGPPPRDEFPSRVLRVRHGNPWDGDLWRQVLARRHEFPIVERSILAAVGIQDLAARLDSLEAVAVRFDTYWPAFWLYADALVHYGALAGRPVDATMDTLRSAIERVRRPWSTRLIGHRDALAARRADAPVGAPGWAARGGWDSAFVRSAPSPDADAGALLDAYRLAVVGNWLGGLPPSTVAERRKPVREEHLDSAGAAELAWLDGLAAAVAQDGDAIDRARLRLGESGAPSATDLERSLRAFQLATVEDEELRGARLLRSLERERADRLRLAMAEDDAHPYLTGVNRLAAAQWFIKHGRSSDALPLLGWWERLPVGAPGIAIADAVLAPVDELQRARAYREVGRPGDAARHFRRFLDAYDLAEGAHRTWVRDARAALAGRPQAKGASRRRTDPREAIGESGIEAARPAYAVIRTSEEGIAGAALQRRRPPLEDATSGIPATASRRGDTPSTRRRPVPSGRRPPTRPRPRRAGAPAPRKRVARRRADRRRRTGTPARRRTTRTTGPGRHRRPPPAAGATRWKRRDETRARPRSRTSGIPSPPG